MFMLAATRSPGPFYRRVPKVVAHAARLLARRERRPKLAASASVVPGHHGDALPDPAESALPGFRVEQLLKPSGGIGPTRWLTRLAGRQLGRGTHDRSQFGKRTDLAVAPCLDQHVAERRRFHRTR